MKEHGRELDDDDREEEKHEHDSDRLQMKVLFRNNYLKLAKNKIIKNSFRGGNGRGRRELENRKTILGKVSFMGD